MILLIWMGVLLKLFLRFLEYFVIWPYKLGQKIDEENGAMVLQCIWAFILIIGLSTLIVYAPNIILNMTE